jgi:hypothetical protein
MDAEGKEALPRFSLTDCVQMKGDHLDQEVKWNGSGLTLPTGRSVRFRFGLRNASLYAFWSKN